MAKKTEAAETTTPCACSIYEAFLSEQLTEENLASGDYEWFTTGCAATTKRTFAPGHDAKLKGFLIRYSGPEFEIRRNEGGVAVTAAAEDHAKRYEFGHMVVAGIAKAQEKAAAKAERAAARAAKKGKAAKPLAKVVKAEEAAHQRAEAAKVAEREASADWKDDQPECVHDYAKSDDIECPECGADMAMLEAEADETKPVVDLTDRPAVIAKVGRWEYRGVVSDEGVLYYLARDGHTRKTAEPGKYEVVETLS